MISYSTYKLSMNEILIDDKWIGSQETNKTLNEKHLICSGKDKVSIDYIQRNFYKQKLVYGERVKERRERERERDRDGVT